MKMGSNEKRLNKSEEDFDLNNLSIVCFRTMILVPVVSLFQALFAASL